MLEEDLDAALLLDPLRLLVDSSYCFWQLYALLGLDSSSTDLTSIFEFIETFVNYQPLLKQLTTVTACDGSEESTLQSWTYLTISNSPLQLNIGLRLLESAIGQHNIPFERCLAEKGNFTGKLLSLFEVMTRHVTHFEQDTAISQWVRFYN